MDNTPPPLTREVFGNIPGWWQAAFYLVAAIAVGMFVYGIARRVQLWRQGRESPTSVPVSTMVQRFARDVLLQRRVWGRGLASTAHVLLFSGFVVLLIGTTLIAIEHVLADLMGREPTNPVFHKGIYFGVYELVTDTFGVALIVGCSMFLYRRWRGVGSFARTPADVGILVLLIVIGLSGYLVEGLRIIHAQTRLAGLSPVGYLTAVSLRGLGVDVESVGRIHFAVWWSHAILALGFVALMPYTRLLHVGSSRVDLQACKLEYSIVSPK